MAEVIFTGKMEFVGDNFVQVVRPADGMKFRLSRDDYNMAQLMDGQHSDEVLIDTYEAAYGDRWTGAELDQFQERLALRELLYNWSSRPVADAADQDTAAASLTQRELQRRHSTLHYLFEVPISWLVPLGNIIALPVHYRAIRWLLYFLVLMTAYGMLTVRQEFAFTLASLREPLNLAQTLLLGMLTVNLVGQLGRASVYRRLTDHLPRFGVVMLFSILPRFMADGYIPHATKGFSRRLDMARASLLTSLVLFVLSGLGWLVFRQSPTNLPLLFATIAALSLLRTVLMLNPLARRPGYYLLCNRLGTPGLREAAFASWRRKEPVLKDGPSRFALRVYGAFAALYLLLVIVLVFVIIGGWLERQWGGLGVIVFLALVAQFLLDPLRGRPWRKS